ncbi:MAG: InlB B-repeat-containing protein, partial [Lachnospiraceae bacterium]|nr:InlB B-repeat-containing protein [Lachnospiraceae bacterium]
TDPVDIENYPIEKAEDFYAIWKAKELQVFTITYEFKSADGDLPQEILDLQESMQGDTVLEGEPVEAQQPDPDEFEFDDGLRWYFEGYENEYVEEASENITFVGWWAWDQETPEGDCKITWHKNYNGSTETETEWIDSGERRYNAPSYWDDDEDILAADLIPGGFYVGSPGGELIDETADMNNGYEITGNIDLYVYWVDAVTITWDPMGGSWDYYDHEIPNGATAPKTARYYVGRYLAINEEGNLTAPNENQVFAGWSLEPNGEIFMPRTNGKRATKDLDGKTLYAVYAESATITIVGGEGAHSWMYDDENDVNGYFGPSTVIVEWPKGIEFDLLSPTYFQKDGAAIRGWTVGDTSYDAYYRFTPDADVTITAVWARPVTVKYYLMGGHFSWSNEDYMEVVYGEGEAIRNYSVVKENYVFCGWNTNEEEAAAGITEYSQYTTLYAQNDIELYAVWKPGFTVTFELNGGTHLYHPGSSFTTTVLPGDTIGSTYYTDGLTAPEGKAFVAWTTVLNDPSTAIPENNPLKVTDNITLYALYANGYSVTFDLNGVTNAAHPEGVYTLSMPEGATIASDYNWYEMVADTVAPSGKAFVGWSTEKNNPDTLITEDNPLVLGQNTILYAFWGDGCAVTFNGMGGLHQNQGTITFSFPVNSTIQLVPSFDWTDSSKAFAYWSTDQGGNGKYTTSGLFGYKLVSDITLYAIWKPGCTVTFDANGGTYYSGTRFTDIYPAGEPIAEHLPYPQGPDENKTLLGYSTTTDRSGLVFNWAQNNLDCVFEDGMLLYAIWADKRTLTFKGNGRKLNARTDTVSVDWPDGEGYYGAQDRVVSDDLKDELKGWSTSQSGYPLFDFTGKTVTSDMTFYAVWGEPVVPKYQVSYEFVSSSDKQLPREVLTLKPGTAEYEDGSTVTAAQMPERVDTEDGHWIFDGYDKDSITI